jgi:hypothetical protein
LLLSLLLALPELFFLFTAFYWWPWISGIVEQQVLLVEKFRASSAETLTGFGVSPQDYPVPATYPSLNNLARLILP